MKSKIISLLVFVLTLAPSLLAAQPKIGSQEIVQALNGTATGLTTQGSFTNKSQVETRLTPLTGTSLTLSWTNGGDYSHAMTADTTLAFANTTGTNRFIVLNAYPDGTHNYIWPSGVVALTPTNQPFGVGRLIILFERLQGTNYLSVGPQKFLDYKDFVYPSRVDGVGATISTNDYSSALWGLATYSGTADTNGNYAVFRIGTVPYDLDSSTAMTLKGFSVRVSATDTDAAEFTIALYSPASSAAYSATDFTGFSTFINFNSGTLTSPAANDVFYFSDITLTGWAAALTAGRPFVIGIARRNGSNDDSVTILGGTIEYGRLR